MFKGPKEGKSKLKPPYKKTAWFCVGNLETEVLTSLITGIVEGEGLLRCEFTVYLLDILEQFLTDDWEEPLSES